MSETQVLQLIKEAKQIACLEAASNVHAPSVCSGCNWQGEQFDKIRQLLETALINMQFIKVTAAE
jgi:hypothetical protein